MSVHVQPYSRPEFVFDAELQAIVDKYDNRMQHHFKNLLRTVYSGMYIKGRWVGMYSQEQVVPGTALSDYRQLRPVSVLIDIRKVVALNLVFDFQARDLQIPGVGPTTANKILAMLAEVRQAFVRRPVATQGVEMRVVLPVYCPSIPVDMILHKIERYRFLPRVDDCVPLPDGTMRLVNDVYLYPVHSAARTDTLPVVWLADIRVGSQEQFDEIVSGMTSGGFEKAPADLLHDNVEPADGD